MSELPPAKLPPPPSKLGDRALSFWHAVVSKYSLRIDELYILECACREVDLIERMAERQKAEDLIGIGSMGQPVVAPLIPELRQHRATLAALVRQLKLPDGAENGGSVDLSPTEKARRAANMRWGNVTR